MWPEPTPGSMSSTCCRADRRRARTLRRLDGRPEPGADEPTVEPCWSTTWAARTFDATVIGWRPRISVLAVEATTSSAGPTGTSGWRCTWSRRFCAEPRRSRTRWTTRPVPGLVRTRSGPRGVVTAVDRGRDRARTRPFGGPATRTELDGMTASLLRRTIDDPLCLAEADRRGGGPGRRALMVGGSSRMPPWPRRCAGNSTSTAAAHTELAVARGRALFGEKKELERMVAADLRTRGGSGTAPRGRRGRGRRRRRVRPGSPRHKGSGAQVRRDVHVQVDTVVSAASGCSR